MRVRAMLEALRFPAILTLAITALTFGAGYFLSDPDLHRRPHFETAPARLARTPEREWVLESDFAFVDARGKRWSAPAGTLTDGASIPQAFLSITGAPTDNAFLDAAVVHDAYCDVRNAGHPSFQRESWEAVHWMFYEACLAAGTTPAAAKIMYAAVWFGGPRWNDPARSLEHVPQETLVAECEKCKAWIEKHDPTLGELDAWMRKREAALLASNPERGA